MKKLKSAETAGRDVLKARRLYEKASYNIDLVEYGRGVHNIRYSQQLIAASMDSLQSVLSILGSSVRLPEFASGREIMKNECYQCHFGMYSIVKHKDRNFPHEMHVVKNRIPCLRCHADNTVPADTGHGRLSGESGMCASCHHKPGASCGRCHPLQKKMYEGRFEYAGETQPDFMFDGGVECESCHLSEEEKVVRPAGRVCEQCHDESYASLEKDWQKEISGLLASVRKNLNEVRALNGSKSAGYGAAMIRYENIISSIIRDGSSGVHNYQMIEGVLTATDEALKADLSRITDKQ